MQEHTEMEIAPLPPVSAAEAARANGPSPAQRRSAAAGFGAALDKALTRPESSSRREDALRELERKRAVERDEEEDRIAAAQQSAWQAARAARERPRAAAAADRRERAAEERRIDAAEARQADAAEVRRNDTAEARQTDAAEARRADAAGARPTEAAEPHRNDAPDTAAERPSKGEAPPPPAAAAAVAMARRIEAARERAAEGTHAAEAPAAAGASASSAAPATEAAARAVHDVERSLDALAPEFRTRLERVIARMEAEGHDVSVTETQRDAERQSHLYAQGRTRPGPVVTWTRNSNHMHGMAADLVIDGSYDNPAGYARLARIAVEEGLRTLGARDAGHLEMGGAQPLVRTATPAAASAEIAQKIGPLYAPARTFAAPQVAAVAEVAAVSPVAGVAQVAQVAAVAQVAQPGSYAPIAQPGSAQPVAQPVPVEGLRAVAALGGSGAKDGEAAGDTTSGDASGHTARPHDPAPAAPFTVDVARTAAAVRSEGADAVLRADVAGRMERVQALQDAVSAQPLSQVTLRVEGEDGNTARINVGLRGNTVGATIDTADPLAAASMRAHVAELRQALERQGLDPSSLLVRAAPRLEGAEAGRLAAALTSADALATLASAAGRESSQREHSAPNQQQQQQQGAARRDPDAQRQRQNRNGKEDRP